MSRQEAPFFFQTISFRNFNYGATQFKISINELEYDTAQRSSHFYPIKLIHLNMKSVF